MQKPAVFYLSAVISFLGFTYFVSDHSNDKVTQATSKAPVLKVRVKPIEATPKKHLGTCGPVPILLRDAPYNLDKFYQQYCDASGIPILSSAQVNPDALRIAKSRIDIMTQKLSPAIIHSMVTSKARIAIIGQHEVMTDIPENAKLNQDYPGKDWNKRSRGLGPTMKRPVTSVGEENILCLKGNRIPGSDLFVHEFAHTIHRLGLNNAVPNFQFELDTAYKEAVVKRNLWKNTYASKNSQEYWAMAVQTWFNVNDSPGGKDENYINTRSQLQSYDPVLYNLVSRYMPHNLPILVCEN